ncbi:hypothetical protein [Umezawaea sp.]|uniref:hypothetical protein n=1 Tax=Umezawaea sp. TaxID=1955258 RepID=UPI002ED25634
MPIRTSTAPRRASTGLLALVAAGTGISTGSPVTLVRRERGPSYGGSDIRDLTDDGLWIPDAYVDTDPTGAVVGACVVPRSFPAKVDLNGRAKKGDQILEAAPPRDDDGVHVRGTCGRNSWTAHAVRYIQ